MNAIPGQMVDPNSQDTCIPLFYITAKLDGGATKEQGRDVYRDVNFVQIIIPGDNNSLVDRPVQEADKVRWPNQWQAHQNKQTAPLDGMPIDNWPMLRPHQVAEAKAIGIFTIEAMANIGDDAIRKLGDWGRQAVERAKMWGDQAEAGALVTKIMQERDDLRRDIKHLQEQFDDLKRASEEEAARHRREIASMQVNAISAGQDAPAPKEFIPATESGHVGSGDQFTEEAPAA